MKKPEFTEEYEQWKAMGNEIQDIREALIKFICNPVYQKLVSNVDATEKLARAVMRIDGYRAKAEYRMLKKVNSDGVDRTKVFYGKWGV